MKNKLLYSLIFAVITFSPSVAIADVSNYKYNLLIDEYNELVEENDNLIDDYNLLLRKYKKSVDKSNELVDEYNELLGKYRISAQSNDDICSKLASKVSILKPDIDDRVKRIESYVVRIFASRQLEKLDYYTTYDFFIMNGLIEKTKQKMTEALDHIVLLKQSCADRVNAEAIEIAQRELMQHVDYVEQTDLKIVAELKSRFNIE